MPRVKQFKEEEVLNKAVELFWKKGYHATSIQDLVDHLGINRASLYATFGGKKQLFDRSFLKYRMSNTVGLAAFLDAQADVKIGLTNLFEMAVNETVNDCDKKGCFVVNTTTELTPADAELQNILLEHIGVIENLFYLFLLKGEERGDFAEGKNLNAIANLIFTLYNGIKVVAKIQPDKKKLLSSLDAVLLLLD